MPQIHLAPLSEQALASIWQEGYSQDQPQWKNWDGPYFQDYRPFPNLETFLHSDTARFLQAESTQGIFVQQEPIGIVTRHWENQATRWLEVGIVIYNPRYWSGGYGSQALFQWITQTFQDFPELEHIGLTTWSGNHRMMRAAEKIGLLKEAQIRKVRYWQEHYYDSVKYGVLREEWPFLTKDASPK